MQPEAIWEVQAHLLSSLSHLPTILQSWQEGNKGSRTQILLSDPLSQGGEFATSHPISHFLMAAFRCLLSPPILFFPRSFAGRWESSSPLLPVPLTFPSPSRSVFSPLSAQVYSPVCCQLCTKRSGVPLEGTVHQEVLDPKACFHFDSVSLCWKCD